MRTSLSASDPRPCTLSFARLKSRRSCAARLTDHPGRPPRSPDPRSCGSSPAIASAGLRSAATSRRHAASIAATVVGFGTGALKSGSPAADASVARASSKRPTTVFSRPCAVMDRRGPPRRMASAPLTPPTLWRRNCVCRICDRLRHAVESGASVGAVVRPRCRAETDHVGRGERERQRGFFPHPNRPGPAAGWECLRFAAEHARFRDGTLPRARPGLPDPGHKAPVHGARRPGGQSFGAARRREAPSLVRVLGTVQRPLRRGALPAHHHRSGIFRAAGTPSERQERRPKTCWQSGAPACNDVMIASLPRGCGRTNRKTVQADG